MTTVAPNTQEAGGVAGTPAVRWTVLIYQSADNNLSEECVYALKEIKKNGTEAAAADGRTELKVNVVALLDPVGRGARPRHFHIRGAGGDGTLHEDTLDESVFGQITGDDIDMSDPETLRTFLRVGIEKFDAEHYMVVLSGHGAGTAEGFFLRDEARPLSQIPSSLPVGSLRGVFDDAGIKSALGGRKIDILGFDACLMSTVEVCYELRGLETLDLVVGSEGFSLNSGWPLHRIVEAIKRDDSIEPLQLARRTLQEHFGYYQDYFIGGLSCDLAVLRLGLVARLREGVDDLARALVAAFEAEAQGAVLSYDEAGRAFQDAVILSHWSAQSFNGEQCVDLFDFCDQLQKRLRPLAEGGGASGASAVAEACEALKGLIGPGEGRFVEGACFTGAAFQHSHGVSIYFPWSEVNLAPHYAHLDFGKESAWLDFLRVYVKATKRLPRFEGVESLQSAGGAAVLSAGSHRAAPPYTKGPEGTVLSMRNPPTFYDPEHRC